ncbi:hypothetical protein [Paenibacillus sp. DMB20]|uniref:hypothetical protein n=1 Tax=Paenibacillus sp. DMB20 TaxID=1642570 RepID=UPI00069A42CB|nr:hypothetical protein [Paenibacillus sp. DMB20]
MNNHPSRKKKTGFMLTSLGAALAVACFSLPAFAQTPIDAKKDVVLTESAPAKTFDVQPELVPGSGFVAQPAADNGIETAPVLQKESGSAPQPAAKNGSESAPIPEKGNETAEQPVSASGKSEPAAAAAPELKATGEEGKMIFPTGMTDEQAAPFIQSALKALKEKGINVPEQGYWVSSKYFEKGTGEVEINWYPNSWDGIGPVNLIEGTVYFVHFNHADLSRGTGEIDTVRAIQEGDWLLPSSSN